MHTRTHLQTHAHTDTLVLSVVKPILRLHEASKPLGKQSKCTHFYKHISHIYANHICQVWETGINLYVDIGSTYKNVHFIVGDSKPVTKLYIIWWNNNILTRSTQRADLNPHNPIPLSALCIIYMHLKKSRHHNSPILMSTMKQI